jgi:chromosomal replication initiator protein
MKPQDAWRATQGQLRVQLHRATYDTWVRDCEFVSFDEGVFTLRVRNAYIKDWLEKRLYRSIKHTLSGIFRQPIDIEFVVASPDVEERPTTINAALPSQVEQTTLTVQTNIEDNGFDWNPRLNTNYSFETFVVGTSNQLAVAAAQAISERPASAYNPLFIYGDSGLGKTHLLHAIGHELAARSFKLLYTTAEQFTNHLVESIRHKTTIDFRDTYRNLDILLIDDVQFLASKGNIQEEFFHTFNALHSQGKQIVLASDRHPEDISSLGERLRSRFMWGLLVDIQPPEFSTRLAILADKAEMQGQHLPLEIAEFIADYVEGNVRDLEGTLTQVLAYSTLMGTGLTLEMTERILRQAREPRDMSAVKRRLRLSDVIEVTARCCQLSLSDLVGKSRNRDVVSARHLAIYIAREETDASLPEIGDALGRNHSTVLYSYNKIASQLEEDQELREKLQAIRERIYSATA